MPASIPDAPAAHAAISAERGAPTRAAIARIAELVIHLAIRELQSLHRFAVLGWAWPVLRQLAQLGVLVLVFSNVVDLHVHHYALFVLVGLMGWTWFSAGISAAADSLASRRHLVFQARFPDLALPVVAVLVPAIDVLLTLPILLVLVIADGALQPAVALLPLLLVLQFVLMCGLGWLAASISVYLRDVPNIIGVGLLLLFYLTPVFYDFARVPHRYAWALRLNPMTTLIDGYRSAFLDRPVPAVGDLLGLGGATAVLAVAGWLVFRRLQPAFVDEL
jgi:lipopolysaccharide transport system permease protein